MAKDWDGKGKPPSRQAAIEWLAKIAGKTVAWAAAELPKSGTLTAVGHAARQVEQQIEENKQTAATVMADRKTMVDKAARVNELQGQTPSELKAAALEKGITVEQAAAVEANRD